MKAEGIRGASRAKKRFTTKSDPSAVRAPDLVNRNFSASRPDALWVADFTYCSTWSGIVYVAFIIDVFSRRLVGWKAARSMTAALVIDALNMAAWTRRLTTLDGLICHTDAGSQYTSILYTERIDEVGAAPSIGTVGDSFDKALVSYCTSCRWLGQNSFGEAASHALDQGRVAGRGWLEERDVLVVGLVRDEQAGAVPGLDGGRAHAETLGDFSDGEKASCPEPVEMAGQTVGAA
jgi:transposase InsO family protein